MYMYGTCTMSIILCILAVNRVTSLAVDFEAGFLFFAQQEVFGSDEKYVICKFELYSSTTCSAPLCEGVIRSLVVQEKNR